MIKSLNKYDFPDKKLVPDGYHWTEIPKASPNNFQVLIDKINEVVELVNKITPQGLTKEKPKSNWGEQEW
jgi:hypothetical protein